MSGVGSAGRPTPDDRSIGADRVVVRGGGEGSIFKQQSPVHFPGGWPYRAGKVGSAAESFLRTKKGAKREARAGANLQGRLSSVPPSPGRAREQGC